MRNYRVGVIGRTKRGDYGHRLDMVWKLLPNTKVVAIADENPEGLELAAERHGITSAYADYREMLRRERPEIVTIAARWPDCHLDMIRAATDAGALGIYMDKPIARTPAEADQILALCHCAGTRLAVAHQMRISPLIEMAKERVAAGAIGQLLELRGRGKEDTRAGGEDLMILGTHIFDLMRQFAGDPAWCFARITQGGRDITLDDAHEGREGLGPVAGDAIAASYAFRDGITGYFATQRSNDVSGKRWGLDLYGSKGVMTIRADMSNPVIAITESNDWTGAPSPKFALAGTSAPRTPDEANQPVAADLIEAIEQKRDPKASGEHAMHALEMAMAVYHSHLSGARVPLPLKNRQNPLAR